MRVAESGSSPPPPGRVDKPCRRDEVVTGEESGVLDVGVAELPAPPARKRTRLEVRCGRCHTFGHEEADCPVVGRSIRGCCAVCARAPEDHEDDRCEEDPFCMGCFATLSGVLGREPCWEVVMHKAGGGYDCGPCPPYAGWPTVESPSETSSSEEEGDGGKETRAGSARTRGEWAQKGENAAAAGGRTITPACPTEGGRGPAPAGAGTGVGRRRKKKKKRHKVGGGT